MVCRRTARRLSHKWLYVDLDKKHSLMAQSTDRTEPVLPPRFLLLLMQKPPVF